MESTLKLERGEAQIDVQQRTAEVWGRRSQFEDGRREETDEVVNTHMVYICRGNDQKCQDLRTFWVEGGEEEQAR